MAELLIPEPDHFEAEIAIGKLLSHTDQILAELI
jgi:hypothetical protein